MKYSILLLSYLLLAVSINAAAKDGTVTAAEGWNNSAGFQTSYDKLTKSVIAELIEKQENGFYDGFDQYNTYHIGAQTTTIGAQTIFNDSTLNDVSVSTTSCGPATSPVSANSGALSGVTIGDTDCDVRIENVQAP